MSEPQTEAGQRFTALVRQAVLAPDVAKLLGVDGRQQLVALVSPDAIRDALAEAEAEAVTRLLAADRCTYKRDGVVCNRPESDKSVHVAEDERMRHGAHVWRHGR